MSIKVLVLFHDGRVEEKHFENEDALGEFLLGVMLELDEEGSIESIEIVEEEEGDEEYVV